MCRQQPGVQPSCLPGFAAEMMILVRATPALFASAGIRRRVSEGGAFHPRKRGKRVRLAPGLADDFLDAKPVHQQSIRDQRTVTAPRHSLGAHQCHALLSCLFHELREVLRKIFCLHVIGVTAERGIAPTLIG